MRQELMEGYKDYLERMNTHTYEIVDGELQNILDRTAANASRTPTPKYNNRRLGTRLERVG